MKNERDEAYLVASGLFVLYEKYHTLNQLTFKIVQEGDGKSLEYTGE